MNQLDVGIVGAGFAGAAAALFLAERGHRVTLYEEAEKPQPVGAGILMQPSGLSVLADLGLLPGALARGSRVDSLLCKTPAGRSVLDLSYRDLFGDWYGLGMHRGALFELLHGQLAGRGVALVTLPASYFDVWLPRFHGPRLAFIGDAAHATSPQLGQGTNLALEDARVLSACVSACRDLDVGLARFSAARLAHARYYQRASWALTPFFQSGFSSLSWLRDLLLGPLCAFPPSRRLMLTTLAGVQRGFTGGTLPLAPIRARLGRNLA